MQQTIGFLLHTLGELFIAFTVLKVHHRVLREHKIDKKVFREMRIEQALGLIGAVLIIVGASLEL
jgi:hypothetical protein